MKKIRLLLIGVLFGIVLTKSEVISWYRIQEMFLFDSFHMYGIIGSAVMLSALIIYFVKRQQLKNSDGTEIIIPDKPENYKAAALGGTIFGLGWALTGACPGPIYVLVGNGYSVYLAVLFSAAVGAFCYGALRRHLPH